MKVIAERGPEALVDLGDPDGLFAFRRGLIVDRRSPAKLTPIRNIDSLLLRGYWKEFSGDPEPVLAIARAYILATNPAERSDGLDEAAEDNSRGEPMPDRIMDVADWGDLPLREPLFHERTPKQLEAAKRGADDVDKLRKGTEGQR